ncbi:phosphatidylinositol 3,4,5-trisphosphate-dependent Rac exchanger 1 protein-like [Meleagris gallopavo]|uniref:phosphatidylinositol 3,4,5-trisphosphate-dependent Rac exchanger 1 protein-like n=1 Tax=Meleagris gallopavo TaxID=9103 RepID=UPI000549B55B|nr:phosphatidylinositol 3,4,5-trisphosphate-dependent Rac exchanger 1 protein-like [Meleagris gallopavo]
MYVRARTACTGGSGSPADRPRCPGHEAADHRGDAFRYSAAPRPGDGGDSLRRGKKAIRRSEMQTRRSPIYIWFFALQKEERTMLEDIQVTLTELDKVAFYFKQLDESLVANTHVFYHIEGSRQALKVIFYLDSYYFSKLPSRFQNGGSLKLHTVLFTKALESMEGQSQPAGLSLEELPQQINGQSLEKVQQYYRKLRTFYLERSNLPTDSNTTAVKIDQLIRPINAMDELCRLMKSFINTKPTPSGYSSSNTSGAGLLPISSELCYRLGACQITMCGTGMQRSTLSVSLEQAAILARSHGLLPKCIMQATDIMRKQGPRVEISAKNLKVMDQMPQCAPRLYRLCQPPTDGDL